MEERKALRCTYGQSSPHVHASSEVAMATGRLLEPASFTTDTRVCEQPTPAGAASSAGGLDAAVRAVVAVPTAAKHPSTAQALADMPQTDVPPRGFSLPLATGATRRQLSAESGRPLPPLSPEETHPPVRSAVSGEMTGERAEALYFAATALSCSGLLCATGCIVLFAIFRSYRLRQQKHEAAKQLIRRLHCSGQLRNPELVVQNSRERGRHEQFYEGKWHQTPAQPCHMLSSSVYVVIPPGMGAKVAAPTAAERERKAPGNAAATPPAASKARTTHLEDAGQAVHCSQNVPVKSNHHSKNEHTTGDMLAAPSLEVGPEQECEVLTEATAAAGQPLSRKGLQTTAGSSTGRDHSLHMRRESSKSSSAVKERIEAATSCYRSTEGRYEQVETPGCQQATPRASASGRTAGAPATKRTTTAHTLWKISPLPLYAKKEQRPQRLPHLEAKEGAQPQCTSQKKHSQLTRKTTPIVSKLVRSPLDQPIRAASEGPASVVHLAVSPQLPLSRPLGTTRHASRNLPAAGSSPISSLNSDKGNAKEEMCLFSGKMRASSFTVPAHACVSPPHDLFGKRRRPSVSFGLAQYLQWRYRGRIEAYAKPRNCGSSGRRPSTGINRLHGTAVPSSRQRDVSEGGKTSGHQTRSEPGRAVGAQVCSTKEPLRDNHQAQLSAGAPIKGDPVTWVGKVSGPSSCAPGINSAQGTGTLDKASAAELHCVLDEGTISSYGSASDWAEGTNTDIPTHMMTTAVNNEEGDNSERAGSQDDGVTDHEVDTVVEFDSSHIALPVQEAAGGQTALCERVR